MRTGLAINQLITSDSDKCQAQNPNSPILTALNTAAENLKRA